MGADGVAGSLVASRFCYVPYSSLMTGVMNVSRGW
jgi:hypothetical protein